MENNEFEMKPVDTIQFRKDDDPDVIQLVNEYASAFNKHVMKKTSPRNAIRNLLLRILPQETKAIIGDGNGYLAASA